MFVVKDIFAVGNTPKAGKLPAADSEFIEQWNGEFSFDGVKQRAVCRVEFLIAVATRARVKNGISRFAVKVGITGIDPPEICKQRQQSPVALVNAVADLMHIRDVIPRQNVADIEPGQVHLK